MRGLRAFGPAVGKTDERSSDLPEPLDRQLLAMVLVALEDDDDDDDDENEPARECESRAGNCA
jgi:hypothetical protein